MNEDKNKTLEQMYAEPENVIGADTPENPESEIGQPEHKAKWPIAIFVVIVFLILIIGALVTGFYVFL